MNPDRELDITDLTQNQLTEMQIFSALGIVGGVKEMVRQGVTVDPTLAAYLERYDTYATELRARRETVNA